MKTHTVNGVRVRCEVLEAGSAPTIRCKAKGRPARTFRGSAMACVTGSGYLVPDTRHAAESYLRA